jgi:selenide,water dikinase
VLVGPGDDAGVYLLGDFALVETVDVISPLVDDPFTFGAISAANSVSDVYAMGGRPLTALAVAGFPSCHYEPAVLNHVLRGALATLDRAGVALLGGHSFDNDELKFGLSVSGVVQRDHILRTTGAQAGDILILTKPLGIGLLTTALKGGKLSDNDLEPAVRWMLTLNDTASALAVGAGATACTDVTGFGLLGHARTMVLRGGIDFELNLRTIPLLDGARAMIDIGMVPAGAYGNLGYVRNLVDFPETMPEEERLLLADPQTSGGLLIALPEAGLRYFDEAGQFYAVIGKVIEGTGRIIVR